MTVEELIAILQEHPSDLRVVVDGYEDGYDDLSPTQIRLTEVALNTGIERYVGVHGEPSQAGPETVVVEARVLQRTSS